MATSVAPSLDTSTALGATQARDGVSDLGVGSPETKGGQPGTFPAGALHRS